MRSFNELKIIRMNNKKILISGGGIAGLTLAYWLEKYGFEPVIIEHASGMRDGGYMIDFWGVGYIVAERMGIVSELEKEQEQYKINEIKFINEKDKQVGGLKVSKLRELTDQRYMNLLRSGLERVLYEKVKDKVEIRFGTTIKEIRQDENVVHVTFASGISEAYDLLIGADGLRSNTRRLVLGPDSNYERFMGYYTAAYTIDNFTGNDQLFLSYTAPDHQIGIYDVGHHKLASFFIYKSNDFFGHISEDEKKQKLRDAYKQLKWYVPDVLERMDTAPDFYFDAVSQIELPEWHKNRVAFVGDACQAVSLISGQGSSLAMTGAYILAGD